MLKHLLHLLFFVSAGTLHAQTTIDGSFIHGGITRTYSFYVPASYVQGNAVPMVIGLHGLSSDGASFAQYRDFRPIADTANFIVVHPDGSTLLGQKFWNYGNVLGSTVDDVGFLEALIDTIAAQFTIDHDRIYCTGMSNGSFMAYYLACQSNRFAAIGAVTGSMSVNMYNSCNPERPTPVMHIHGTADGVNPYEGTSSMVGIDEMIRFWVNQNECDTVPVITQVPDTDPGDNATATRYLYPGGINNTTVELFKVTGGEHTWPGSPMPGSSDITCMDFAAQVEIWRFFSQYSLSAVSITENMNDVKLAIWPNPARDIIHIQAANTLITDVAVVDLQGRVIEKITNENIRFIDLKHLEAGNYLLKISGKDFYVVKKVMFSAR